MAGTITDLIPICAICKKVFYEKHECKELDDPILHKNHKRETRYSAMIDWTIVKCLDCDEIIVNKWGK